MGINIALAGRRQKRGNVLQTCVTGTDTAGCGHGRFTFHDAMYTQEQLVYVTGADIAVKNAVACYEVAYQTYRYGKSRSGCNSIRTSRDVRWESGGGLCFRNFMLQVFNHKNGVGDLSGGLALSQKFTVSRRRVGLSVDTAQLETWTEENKRRD